MPTSYVKNSVERSRRYGASASLTQALPKRLSKAGNCTDKDNAGMQKLADVDYHIIHLLGLACLSYPVVLRPIVEIPQNRKEAPSLEIVRAHPHLRCMADNIHSLDESAKIQLLIGRNVPKPLKVQAFKNGPMGAP